MLLATQFAYFSILPMSFVSDLLNPSTSFIASAALVLVSYTVLNFVLVTELVPLVLLLVVVGGCGGALAFVTVINTVLRNFTRENGILIVPFMITSMELGRTFDLVIRYNGVKTSEEHHMLAMGAL
jgi:hypothetical protein